METNTIVLKLEVDPVFYNKNLTPEDNYDVLKKDIEAEIEYHWHGYKLKILKASLEDKEFVRIY